MHLYPKGLSLIDLLLMLSLVSSSGLSLAQSHTPSFHHQKAPLPSSHKPHRHKLHKHKSHKHKPHRHQNKHKDHSLHHDFDQPLFWFKRFNSPDRKHWQNPRRVVEALDLKPHHTVVDLGTGTGYFLPYLQEKITGKGQILALDVGPKLVAFLKDKKKIEQWTHVHPQLIQNDDPLLSPQSIDCILIVNTWHHLPQTSTYLLKLKKSLKANGQIAIVDFKKSSSKGPPTRHKIPQDQVVKTLKRLGLKVKIHDLKLSDQYMISGFLSSHDSY